MLISTVGVYGFVIALVSTLSVVEAKQSVPVTCGSTIKLQHSNTKYRLHSHEIAYGSGSGQQSVTAFEGSNDANSYWVIRGSTKHPCPQGTPISPGTKFRLQHVNTKRWLHSHHHSAPISSQHQEVSCYGDEDKSDSGDIWKFEAEKGSGVWTRDAKARLVHDETGVYLMSHDKKFGRPIAGQQEVCGTKKKNSDSFWVATEGVYMPDASATDDLDDEL